MHTQRLPGIIDSAVTMTDVTAMANTMADLTGVAAVTASHLLHVRYLVLERQLFTSTSPFIHTCPRPSADGRGCPGEGELEEGETTFVCPVCFAMR